MAVFTERQRINLINLVVTLGVLFVAVELSSGSFATRINRISENLDRALAEVMDLKNPNFTDLTNNATYISDTFFHPKGMAGLYNLTNAFMELIFSKDIYPEGFVRVENQKIYIGDYRSEWQSLLVKYVGLLTMIIILALIIVFMPFCGLCFCCCRCCGKCGARSQPFDKKHDLCKKIILATILIGLGTLLLFGVVCAFVSNQQMQDGVDDLTDNLRKGVKDVDTYLGTTEGQINTLLDKNYQEFEFVLVTTINESSETVYDELMNFSNAISMTELANIISYLPKIRDGFSTLKASTNTLRIFASQLSDAVRKVKKDLLKTLSGPACDKYSKCKDVSKNISLLQTNIHFNNLPDITDEIEDLDVLVSNESLINAMDRGKQKLEEIKTNIGQKVNKTLGIAYEQIVKAGVEINSGRENVTKLITDLRKQVDDKTKPALDTADKYIKQYGPYRYYFGLAISCILLLISVFVALGLICGICGKRPDGYGDDCCNKGAGSQFLICGVMFMFIAGCIIGLVVLLSFLMGIVTQRIICDPLREPENSKVFKLIDQVNFTNYIDFNVDRNISTALIKCYKNKTIYEVLELKDMFNIDDVKGYLDKFEINKTLIDFENSINFTGKVVELLNKTEKEMIAAVANSEFAFVNLDEFKDLLNQTFTTVNLTTLSDDLGDLINQIINSNSGADTDDLVQELQVSKLNIEMYQEKIVVPMISNASNAATLAIALEENLTMNRSSFQKAITDMLEELDKAEDTLTNHSAPILKKILTNFANGIINQIQTYLNRIVDKTYTQVGECGPLSLVINATLTSTCDKILLPWNGFWFGLFWSLILFIPTIIVSVKLATLYQKHSAYSRDLVEAEYLYDAYVDRDNIPLNSSRSSKHKKKNKKHKRYEDRPVPSAGGDMVVREYAAGSNHQDTRYADMAPKQWEDFPAGGPPQYQRAPTEYERPPPYYYPGAAGENTQ